MFADDTTIVLTGENENCLQLQINSVLANFSEWCYKNHLIVNLGKTKYIEFTGKYMSPLGSLDVSLHGINIECVEKASFLGTVVDSRNSWEPHIESICKRLNSLCYAIRSMRSKLSVPHLLNVYYGLVYPILSYNVIVWGQGDDVERVFIGQKRIIRTIFNMNSTESCREKFEEYRILTLTSIYLVKLLSYIHRNIGKFEKSSEVHEYNTRSRGAVRLATFYHLNYKKSPIYAGCSMFNMLPEDLKTSNHITFKKQIKKIVSMKPCYSIDEFLLILNNQTDDTG